MTVVERRFPSERSASGHIEEPRAEPADGTTVPFTVHGLRHLLRGYSRRNVEALREPQQRITDYLRNYGLPL